MKIYHLKSILIFTLIFFLLSNKSFGKQSIVFQKEVPKDSLLQNALMHHSNGVEYYKIYADKKIKYDTRVENLDSAIYQMKIAAEMRSYLYKDFAHVDLGKSLHNLGAFYSLKGEYKEAKKQLKKALEIYESLDIGNRKLRTLSELGKIYSKEGEYILAEECFVIILKQTQKENVQGLSKAIVDLGSLYVATNRHCALINLYEKYQYLFNKSNNVDPKSIGKFYNNLGSAYLKINAYKESILNFNEAIKHGSADVKEELKSYVNLAAAYRLAKDFKNSFASLKRAKVLSYESNDIGQQAFYHKGMARYYHSIDNIQLSLAEYAKAISLLIPSFSPTDNIINPNPSILIYVEKKLDLRSYFSNKAELLIDMDKKKYQKEIIELFKLGDLLIDLMRKDHFLDDTKIFWREEVFPFYEDAINYCHEINSLEDAFYFFEKSKSVLLMEGYSFNEAISKTPIATQNKYKELKKGLSQSQKNSTTEIDQEKINDLKEFENFLNELENDYPRLFNQYKKLKHIPLNDFSKENILDSTTTIVQYFYGKYNVFGFFTNNKKSELIKLGEVCHFDSIINELRGYFAHPATIDNNFQNYKQLSNDLYQKVLGSFIDAKARTLIIIPDGSLSLVPFESLVVSNPNVNDSLRYVIQDKIIRYSFSNSLLGYDRKQSFHEKYDIVSFLPYSGDSKLGNIKFSGIQENNFALNKDKNLKIKFFKRKDANKNKLLALNKGVPIIHLSSHGFQVKNKEPNITLYNSSISISEIFTTWIPSDLVFLSACETNLGENIYGEGIQSMARAFTYAGAKSVISSLWNVVASPNSNLVDIFYENISLGKSKHLALHDAKLAYLSDPNIPMFQKSPYYWSGLIYYGNDGHIEFSKHRTYPNWWYIFGSLFLIMSFYFYKHIISKS